MAGSLRSSVLQKIIDAPALAFGLPEHAKPPSHLIVTMPLLP